MLLTDEELARLQPIAPFLQSEARTSLEAEADYEIVMELENHLQPGLRVRGPESPATTAEPDAPPYRIELFVGLPLAELRALANANERERDDAIALFGATFSPRLLRAIAKMTPHEINLDAGVQSESGTLSVMLEAHEAAA
ncbi:MULTISPECIES: hypothetical protein [unclassified Caballeronia]|uniref:hypothetical protein n=1 Tax=unclassified Caballeronia TaxID=2646786 RepID=UPI0028564676|nr:MULTISPECIES: hypothetical protein [unclassified Caballeronia]MDR5740637.1 hypothetical protein [Caballeronia sp. LZ016]MDR5808840.1 hypothetical protein [Caballeronia sp. LZ019]